MPKRKRGNRVALSFLATVGVLVLLVASSYFWGGLGPGVPVKTIPQTFPAYGGLIGRFAPSNVLQVSYDNLTAVRAINSSALTSSVFLNLQNPPLKLDTSQIAMRLSIGLSNPNATVNVAFLSPAAFQAAQLAFANAPIPPTQYGGFNLYVVADKTGNLTQYWLTLMPNDKAIAFSAGAIPAFDAMETVLSVYNGGASSVLVRQDVQRMLYAVNGTSGHLAVGLQNFPGEVQTGQMTLITVDSVRTSLKINYVIKFSDSHTAQSQVGRVRADFLGARQFVVFDELVRATETQPISGLRAAVGLVG